MAREEGEERDRPLPASDAFYHACTGVSLKTNNILVMCDTTYRTGLHDNCGLKNFQRAVSTGHEHSTLNKTGFENQYVLDERTCRRLAEVSLYPIIFNLP